ncbi:MAG TPA: NADH-ubiquinone oxidoreductase-F iron-sulfur binding region domain-containing protein [Sedimentisphaerales bacterium]|nr:NADH-ubiquinone oxidoreductase-F iron-sulfur binding region domain-containing protein [Sedimentisphaerales bacterium]
MLRLSSLNQLEELRNVLSDAADENVPRIVIPAGTCGQAGDANDLIRVAKREILAKSLTRKVRLRVTGCHGFCQMEPSVLVEPRRVFYPRVGLKEMERIVQAAAKDQVLADILFVDLETGRPVEKQDDIPFFSKQVRRLLSWNEKVDPIRIYDYIEAGGYSALAKVFAAGEPSRVVEEVKRSGLRGRGGGGFPTGLKWELLARQSGKAGKFLVCNADEGDPGAYMDRSVLEGNPHSIIEGMIIGAYGTGATEGITYVRKEYPLAIRHLGVALQQARELGLLGEDILGTGFLFDIRLVKGAGAFVCGEETALIRSVEGKMGEPRQRPPFPIQKGINGRPTAINNVETWANIPLIFRLGAEEFAKVGTKNNSGTKIFSLVGKIKNTGLVEVPMGITIKEIVYDIGGGPVGKARIKAVQTGGPSGGCIPADMFDLPVDYDSLTQAGSIMGSGGMIVMDNNTCMVDVARYFMNFLKDESCGKCFTCRKGTQRMYEILDDISKGEGKLEHIELLKELAEVVKDTTMCGLGQTASNPVLSTLRYFPDEYTRHVVDKKCEAFVCRELAGAPCQTACPVGTEVWRYVALIEKGRYEEAYQVIRDANPFPSVCARVCDRKCETRCNHAVSGGEAIAVRALKRFVTDRVDPSVYKPARAPQYNRDGHRIAIIGSGPAGLSAAHCLSLLGYKPTLIESENQPGGMLVSCIPAYRLPRDVLSKEIESLLDENITLRCGTTLGPDVTIDELFKDSFRAVFLAIGADKSWRLDIEGEDTKGVYPSMHFLKAFNLRGEELAKGHVGIVGGGNSAVDAARVAMRQKAVRSVTLLYRRTYQEMPAYAEEVEAALEEGIKLETLVSPVKIRYIEAARAEGVRVETFVSPIKIDSRHGRLADIRCIRNKLGDIDSSGRRRPVPIPGTEFTIPLDTLIVAIGERPDSDCLASMGLEVGKSGVLHVDAETLCTNRPGVFAGGDLVTGPNTVVDAVAMGKKAASVIDRYINGKELREPPRLKLPEIFVEPAALGGEEYQEAARSEPATLPAKSRKKNFAEVEMTLSVEQATREARRCLRCDLEFTQPKQNGKSDCPALEEKSA